VAIILLIYSTNSLHTEEQSHWSIYHLAVFGHAGCLNCIHSLCSRLDSKERQNAGASANIQNDLHTSQSSHAI